MHKYYQKLLNGFSLSQYNLWTAFQFNYFQKFHSFNILIFQTHFLQNLHQLFFQKNVKLRGINISIRKQYKIIIKNLYYSKNDA